MSKQPTLGELNVSQPKQTASTEPTKNAVKTPKGTPKASFDHNKIKQQEIPQFFTNSSKKSVSSSWMTSITGEKSKNNIQASQKNGLASSMQNKNMLSNTRQQPLQKNETPQNIRNLNTRPTVQQTSKVKPNTNTNQSVPTKLSTNTNQPVPTKLSTNTNQPVPTKLSTNTLNKDVSRTKSNNTLGYKNVQNVNADNAKTVQNKPSKFKTKESSPAIKNFKETTTEKSPEKTEDEKAIQPTTKINVQISNAIQSEATVPKTTLNELVAKVSEVMTMIERSDKNEFVITLNDIKGMEGVQLKISEFKHATKELNLQFFGLSHDMAHKINAENTSAVLKGMLTEKGFTLQQLQTDVKQDSENLSHQRNRDDNQQEQSKDKDKQRFFAEEQNNWI
jgi:hypothetical protein